MRKLLTLLLLAFVFNCFIPAAEAGGVKVGPSVKLHKHHPHHPRHRWHQHRHQHRK